MTEAGAGAVTVRVEEAVVLAITVALPDREGLPVVEDDPVPEFNMVEVTVFDCIIEGEDVAEILGEFVLVVVPLLDPELHSETANETDPCGVLVPT